jgi:hypothetical protein
MNIFSPKKLERSEQLHSFEVKISVYDKKNMQSPWRVPSV